MSDANISGVIDAINAAVEGKTFSLDAIAAIGKLREHIASLEADLRNARESNDRSNERIVSISRENEALRRRVGEHEARIAGMLLNSEEAAQAKHDTKAAKAVADAYKDILHTIFRPSTVRETIQRNVVVPVEGNPGGNGGFPTPGYVHHTTVTDTKTTENT